MPLQHRQESFLDRLSRSVERCLACEADSVGTVEFWSVGVLGFCSIYPRMRFDIIWLNGTSSSGKSRLAEELQALLDDHFLRRSSG